MLFIDNQRMLSEITEQYDELRKDSQELHGEKMKLKDILLAKEQFIKALGYDELLETMNKIKQDKQQLETTIIEQDSQIAELHKKVDVSSEVQMLKVNYDQVSAQLQLKEAELAKS